MDMLLISENKIKISLTKVDLDGYSITCDGIDYDNTETRRVFWSILDEAKHKTGFDAARSRIFVQIYPDKDGGCELYVSKLRAPENGKKVLFSLAERRCGSRVFGFDDAGALLGACKRLGASGYAGTSDAFYDGEGRFYLKISEGNGFSDIPCEYGSRQDSADIGLYIAEHCRAVRLGDAVETLGAL